MSKIVNFKRSQHATSYMNYADTYPHPYIVSGSVSLTRLTKGEPVHLGLGPDSCPQLDQLQACPTTPPITGDESVQKLSVECASFCPVPAIGVAVGVCALKAFSAGYTSEDFKLPVDASIDGDMLNALACPFVDRQSVVASGSLRVPVMTRMKTVEFPTVFMPGRSV